MVNLRTQYMGLDLENPIVASASPLSRTLDGMRRLEDAGVSAIVMFSLFEEQIAAEASALEHYLSVGTESFGEALSYLPNLSFRVGVDDYLELIRNAKAALDIPVIGSLNGVSSGGWTEYARHIEEAGADALELNVYYVPADPDISGAEVERMYLDVVREVRRQVRIPLAVKISPYFSSTSNMARALTEAGADALVLFNRFYQPDFDLDVLDVVPSLVLSREEEMRLPLRWVALLYGRVKADFAITSGVGSHQSVLKAMMAGARVAMMASELLRCGTVRVKEILDEMRTWMETFEYASVAEMQGSMAQVHVADPSAFERANYAQVLSSFRRLSAV